MMVMWMQEVITERGIGQGASLGDLLNIVATLPRTLGATIESGSDGRPRHRFGNCCACLVFLATIVGIIFVQEGARRFRL